jgi:hypothetical protein
MALLGAGVALGLLFLAVGALLVVTALSMWIAQLLPGARHVHEPLADARPTSVTGVPGGVDHLRPGMPGYRLRLPEQVHPTSAGLKGGLIGAAVMPVPALLWGLFSGHGLWFPVNLLAGMALPGVGRMGVPELEQFHGLLLVVALVIHLAVSVVLGLIFGVLLPTLPAVPRPIAWGGMLAPILWTAMSYVAMRVVDPAVPALVRWPWFILSQFVFGITMPAVVLGLKRLPRVLAGIVGGLIGGAAMAVPAVLWAATSGHGFWYPVNLLAATLLPGPGALEADLGRFHAEWFLAASAIHVVLSVCFGVVFALVAPRLPAIPAPVAWGGLVLPLLWTGTAYGLMGVVNPVLQEQLVDWSWFIASQFVFGVAAALVVYRSEMIHIPPAGFGRDRASNFVAGEAGGQS